VPKAGGSAPVSRMDIIRPPRSLPECGWAGRVPPWLFEGAMDGEMFLAWLRQGRVPTLSPGGWVILDNLATHKVAGVQEALAAAGGAPALPAALCA